MTALILALAVMAVTPPLAWIARRALLSRDHQVTITLTLDTTAFADAMHRFSDAMRTLGVSATEANASLQRSVAALHREDERA